MASEAIQPNLDPTLKTRSIHRPVNRTVERGFFAGMAILLCVIVVIGFSHTYFLVGMVRAPLPNALVHIHGGAFTLWMTLFLVQTALVSARRVAWHRALGTVAFCLPPIMIVLGTITAIDGLRRGVRIGPLDPSISLAIPLLGMVQFAIVILAAWLAKRRPDYHKRYILYATIGLCEAALGRFPWTQMGLTPGSGAVLSLGALLLIPLVYDLISLHRIHRASMWAAPLTFAAGAFAVPIGMSSGWHSFAALLARTIAPHV
ncbi:hypothetical protein [Acidicapsa ligni]|uniref:hypothetical protein n=1 Tax=Acidicapsa ligni TaxID=542300 RepID=UPI0021DFCCE6|nr:hypothetical protein [Acidicapsa ligni]